MSDLPSKMRAFFCRDLISDATYKAAFLLQLAGMFVSVLTYFFLSRLMGDIGVQHLAPYGGNYFAFVLIGIAFISYLNVSITGLSGIIREGQMLGTLEAILVTPTSIPTVLFSSSLYGFFWATINVVIYIFLGTICFDLHLEQANLTAAFIILLLTIISSTGVGIMSASFIMIVDQVQNRLLLFRELIAFIAVGKQELTPAVFPVVAGMIETHPAGDGQFLHGQAQLLQLFPGVSISKVCSSSPGQGGAGPGAKRAGPDVVRIDLAEHAGRVSGMLFPQRVLPPRPGIQYSESWKPAARAFWPPLIWISAVAPLRIFSARHHPRFPIPHAAGPGRLGEWP
jgi:hypothetical protein